MKLSLSEVRRIPSVYIVETMTIALLTALIRSSKDDKRNTGKDLNVACQEVKCLHLYTNTNIYI